VINLLQIGLAWDTPMIWPLPNAGLHPDPHFECW
jgi:hypothetical protein